MADSISAKGALFKNERKSKENQPDWTGNVEVTPALLQALLREAQISGSYKAQIAAWIRKGPSGTFLSLSLNPPFVKTGETSNPNVTPLRGRSLDDDPFR